MVLNDRETSIEGTETAPTPEHFLRMVELISGHWISQAVRTSADLHLADHLAEGPLTAEQIAERENSNPEATFRLMRACTAIGLLRCDEQRRFSATPLLNTLRTDLPGSLRAMALMHAAPGHWLSWGQFPQAVRDGRSRAVEALGTDLFTHFEHNPAEGQLFSDAMTGATSMLGAQAAATIDTTAVGIAADIGGANGTLLHFLAEANPSLRGVILDRPNIVAGAAAMTKARGLDDRIEVSAGDFFQSVPPADLYLLKLILHDWDDSSCVRILRRCREAMRPGGRVAVIELLVGPLTEPMSNLVAMFDMNMLATQSGQERDLAEYDALFAQAGLRRTAVRPLHMSHVVIEAVAR